ncbi:MAG: diguanylate cyclase/phosphodiesterase [Solirubrobacterales bacterium]|nr:diguanylate cyclase/phosphodiesterase [Solirubrobacterales bacterium]
MLAFGHVASRGDRRVLAAAFTTVLAVVALAIVHAIVGLGSGVDAFIRVWGSSAVHVLVAGVVVLRARRAREQRLAWSVLAAGLLLYGLGNVLWNLWIGRWADPPIPSICDGLWLALYPASYVGIALLAREPGRRLPAGVWLDGVIAGLGISALGAALVFGPVLDAATGGIAAVATNLAYPIADLLLAALVVGVLALRGWQLDRFWALLGLGFLTLGVADSAYLLQVAGGSPSPHIVTNILYMASVAILGAAAWQSPAPAPARLDRWSVFLMPGAFLLAALVILVVDHYHPFPSLAVALAALTMIAGFARMAVAFRDIRASAETRHQAVTDELTNLPNRRWLQRRLHAAMHEARTGHGALALLIIDLDGFKVLNDTLGHQTGDRLLQEIGPRLQPALRHTDTLARLGGDEFAVLVAPPADETAAEATAERIRAALAEPFVVAGLQLHVAASIGIALFPTQADSAEQLVQRADIAMYEAKARRTGHAVYAPARDPHSREALALAGELRQALCDGQIRAHFQPKADARTGQIVGVEALVRWAHPQRGLLTPATFLSLAEQTGLVRELTRRVLAQALAQCQAWRRLGHEVHVAVNVAVADLLDVAFPGEVAAALTKFELPPSALVLEVTETSIFSDPARIGDVLREIAALGVRLSLDDFGTGFSSLSHLKTLPVHEVKIDRSFVSGVTSDPRDAAIVRSTIELVHALDIVVVAEGVEDVATWELIAALGGELVQGHALSRPLPASDVTSLLAAADVVMAAPAP